MKLCLSHIFGALAFAPSVAWSQCEIYKLTGLIDLPQDKSQLGYSVSLDEDRLAVGMVWGGKPGEARVYERAEAGWLHVATLQASDATPGDDDNFGFSVAIEGDTLIVGAHEHGFLDSEGAAYVFERQPDGAWLETQILLPPESDTFAMGWAVEIDGDRAVVGAKGASIGSGKGKAFVYERNESGWVKVKTIKPPVGYPGDAFGAALALQGERLVVGASYGYVGTSEGVEGKAYLFEVWPPGTSAWILRQVFAPADLDDFDRFGQDVALDGDRILVGAPEHDLPVMHVGAVYEFQLVSGLWTQTAKISSEDLTPGTNFGWSLDLREAKAVIGARGDGSVAPLSGAAYLYELGSEGWSQAAKFTGSGLAEGDTFGFAVDLEGTEVLVGAPNAAVCCAGPGMAHLFSFEAGPHLLADAVSVSVSLGGSQELQLGACPEHALDLYFLAGSASGTAPGFAFGAFLVPLNPDAYLGYTLLHPGEVPLPGSFGVLDAYGRATASFTLPAGVATALPGLVLHHAYAVLDAATLAMEAVSPPVPVALAP